MDLDESESATREAKASKEMLQKLQRLHEVQMNSINSSIKELSDSLHTLSTAKELETTKKLELQEQNKDLRLTIDKLRSQVLIIFQFLKNYTKISRFISIHI